MKKGRFIFYCTVLMASLVLTGIVREAPGQAAVEVEEHSTSLGRVIVGIDKERALAKFGVPETASDTLWYYGGERKFFVYFPASALLEIFLYPQYSTANAGVPLEFKAYGYYSDQRIRDITEEAEFFVNETESFLFTKPGVFIPRRSGEYEVMARSRKVFSNPSRVVIKKGEGEEGQKEEQCLAVNILPYRPVIYPDSRFQFTALGTFFDPAQHTYSIREVSHQALWFVKSRQGARMEKNNVIYFTQPPGILEVFCKYRGIESPPMEVEIYNPAIPLPQQEGIKHILLLPELIFAGAYDRVLLKALATYHSNKIEDVTGKAFWKISDKDVLTETANDDFIAESEGVTDVFASLAGVQSNPVKVIVTGSEDKSASAAMVGRQPQAKPPAGSAEDLFRGMKRDAQDLSKKILKDQNKLKEIRVVPDNLRIALGEGGQVSAVGIYSDGTEDDLTLYGDWFSSEPNICAVEHGSIETRAQGTARVYLRFKDSTSSPCAVTVEPPRLVSVILTPAMAQVSMRGSLDFKAEANYSDGTRKDVTEAALWHVSNPRVLSVKAGKAKPLWVGQVAVSAEYDSIVSLPAQVKVNVTADWLFLTALKALAFLAAGVLLLFALLYILTEREKNRLLRYLHQDPREFIIRLYDNSRDVLGVFGFRHKGVLPPISFARLVAEQYAEGSPQFLRLTARFEEAKFSRHVLQPEDAASALRDYNGFLGQLCNSKSKTRLIFARILALLKTKPVFIAPA